MNDAILSRHHDGTLNQRVTALPEQFRHTASRKHPHATTRAPDAPGPHEHAEVLGQHRERRQGGQEAPSGWRPDGRDDFILVPGPNGYPTIGEIALSAKRG